MAISSVVTRGYGPGASIALVVTRGYSLPPVVERRGGAGAFTPAEIAAHKARQRRFLASLSAAKLSPDEAMLLARLIAEMRNLQSLPPREEEPEIAAEVEEAVTETLAKPEVRKAVASALVSFTPAPMPDENSLAGEIEALRATVARMIAAREDAEEDDLEALLLLAA